MVYVVNELCDVDEIYNNCHGVFTSREEAYKVAMEVYEQAKNDLRDCDMECDQDTLSVWNDDNIISITVNELKLTMQEDQLTQLAGEIADITEDLLEENDITIPDEHRTGADGEARLYGESYYKVEDNIKDILRKI